MSTSYQPQPSRRTFVISLAAAWCSLIAWPKRVWAGLPIWSWRLFSVGPLSFEAGISLDLGLVGSVLEFAGGVIGGIISLFSDSDDDEYDSAYPYQRHPAPPPPPPEPVLVTITASDRMNGDQIHIRLYRIVDGRFIHLPKNGRLRIKKDGKLEFEEAAFEGYATLSYHQQLTVFRSDGKLILAVTRQGDNILFLCHDSVDGRKAIEALVGAPPSFPES